MEKQARTENNLFGHLFGKAILVHPFIDGYLRPQGPAGVSTQEKT